MYLTNFILLRIQRKIQEIFLRIKIRKNPDYTLAYYNLSRIYREQERYKEEVQLFKKALKNSLELTEWIDINLFLGWAYIHLTEYDNALTIANRILEKAIDGISIVESYYLMGAAYGDRWKPGLESTNNKKDYMECIKNLEHGIIEAKKIKDNDIEARILSYFASVEKEKDPEKAIILLRRAIELPNLKQNTLIDSHYSLGQLYDDFYQDFEQAKIHLKESISLINLKTSNKLSEIYTRLSVVLWNSGEVSEAYTCVKRALKVVDMSLSAGKEKKADALRWMGDIYYQSERFNEAIKHYKRLLKTESNDLERSETRKIIGYSFTKLKKYRQAKKYLLQALNSGQLVEEEGSILYLIGFALFHMWDYKKAIEYFTKSITRRGINDSSYFQSYRWRGHCFYRLGEYEKAANDFQQALTLVEPDDPYCKELTEYLDSAKKKKS